MKEIDKITIANAIIGDWWSENIREQKEENAENYTEAARAVGAMHALCAVFNLRGEDAPPMPESVFSMVAKGLAKAMNEQKDEEKQEE